MSGEEDISGPKKGKPSDSNAKKPMGGFGAGGKEGNEKNTKGG